MKDIKIGKQLIELGIGVFNGCKNIESIIVDDNNSYYDSRNNCNAIIETATNKLAAACKNTKIPTGIEAIRENAFRNITVDETIIIPNTVTKIEEYAFAELAISDIIIPKSIKEISKYSFFRIETKSNSVYLYGNEEDFAILLDYFSFGLNKYFYSEEKPNKSGNYWHYVDGVPIIWA